MIVVEVGEESRGLDKRTGEGSDVLGKMSGGEGPREHCCNIRESHEHLDGSGKDNRERRGNGDAHRGGEDGVFFG